MLPEIGDLRLYEFLEIRVFHLHRVFVRPAVKDDLDIFLEYLIDVGIEAEEVPEGRHRSGLIIRDYLFDILLGRYLDRFALQHGFELLQVDELYGGKDR